MGRWVTSKGRRIYIPDEGEENPYAKKSKDIKQADERNGKKETYHVEHTDSVGGKFVDKGKVGDYEIGEKVNYLSSGQMRSGTITKAHIYPNGKIDYNVVDKDGDGHNVSSKNLAKTDDNRFKSKEELTKQKQIASNKAQAEERNGKIKPYYVDQETQIMGEKMSSRGKMIYAKSEEEALSQYKKDYPKGNARIKESKYPEHIKKAQELNKSQADKINGKKKKRTK